MIDQAHLLTICFLCWPWFLYYAVLTGVTMPMSALSLPTLGSQLVDNPLFNLNIYSKNNSVYTWALAGSVISVDSVGRLSIGPSAGSWSTASQSISGLVPGRLYLLTFYLQNSATRDCAFAASIDTNVLLNYTNTAFVPVTPISVTFTALTATQQLSFGAYNSPSFFYVSVVTLYTIGE